MTWIGFGVLGGVSMAALLLGSRIRRWRPAGTVVALALLVGSVWLRYAPTVELRLFSPSWFAHVRPWWCIVFGLLFLGSAAPQIHDRSKRRAVGVLALVLFAAVLQRAGATASVRPAEFTGEPHPRTGVCRQTTSYSCGAAAAATLLTRLRGEPVTEAEMAERCLTNYLSGTDEIGIVKGLREKLPPPHAIGLERVGPDELDRLPLPALAAIDRSLFVGHWVVLLALDESTVTIADPSHEEGDPEGGLRLLPRSEFEEDFRGIVVTAELRADDRLAGARTLAERHARPPE